MRPVFLMAIGIAYALQFTCIATKPSHPESVAEMLGQDGARQFNSGNFSDALRLYRRALAEAGRIDNPALRARYQFNIGRVFYECSLPDSARKRFRESALLFSQCGNREDAAVAGVYTALTFAYGGTPDTAAILLEQYAPAAGEANRGIVATAGTIIRLLQGELEQAQRESEEAMELACGRKDPFLCGGVFYTQAMIAFAGKNIGQSRALLDSSLQYYAQSPYRFRNWKSLLGRAIVEYCSGDSLTATRFYRRSKMAAPAMVVFPAPELVRNCPDGLPMQGH